MKNIVGVVLILLYSSLNGVSQSKIISKEYATAVSEILKTKISSNTGRNAYASVSEVEFDYGEDLYIIDMTADWSACEYALDCLDSSARQNYWVSGILKVSKSGKVKSFRKTSAFKNISYSSDTLSEWLVGKSL
jgi:hypothetical protein